MKNLVLILILILFANSQNYAQPADIAYYAEYLDIYRKKADKVPSTYETKMLSDQEIDKIKGSPYIHKEFLNGSIFIGDSLIIEDIPLRFNAYSDQIEINNPDATTDSYAALLTETPNMIVTIKENTYKYLPDFKDKNKKTGSHFEIVFINKHYDLYKKTIVNYIPPFLAKTSMDTDKAAEFSQVEIFYLVSKTGEFELLPSSTAKLIKSLNTDKKKLKDYVIKNDLDLAKERDLSRFIAYYNSLL